jgi:hypothetical protein
MHATGRAIGCDNTRDYCGNWLYGEMKPTPEEMKSSQPGWWCVVNFSVRFVEGLRYSVHFSCSGLRVESCGGRAASSRIMCRSCNGGNALHVLDRVELRSARD